MRPGTSSHPARVTFDFGKAFSGLQRRDHEFEYAKFLCFSMRGKYLQALDQASQVPKATLLIPDGASCTNRTVLRSVASNGARRITLTVATRAAP